MFASCTRWLRPVIWSSCNCYEIHRHHLWRSWSMWAPWLGTTFLSAGWISNCVRGFVIALHSWGHFRKIRYMLDRINVRSWIGPHCEIQVNYLDSVRDWKSWCLASNAETKSWTSIHCFMPKGGRPFHSQGMRRRLQFSVVVSKRIPLDYTPSLPCDAIAVALWLLADC